MHPGEPAAKNGLNGPLNEGFAEFSATSRPSRPGIESAAKELSMTPKKPPKVVLTIGHSTRTLDSLIELLEAHRVERLVDVRTIPRSRRNPQFNRETLPAALRKARIGYRHMKALGGLRHARRDSPNTAWRNASFRGYADYMLEPEFAAALDRLIGLAAEKRTAVMCAEAVPWRCHRSMIADALLARGIAVEHILGTKRAEPHRLTAFARVEGERVTYPGEPLLPGMDAEPGAPT
jgi:Domain of unknown function DUF488